MSGKDNYLLDTNTIIDFLAALLPSKATFWVENAIHEKHICTSIINKIEVLGFNANIEEEDSLTYFITSIAVLPLTDAIAEKTIQLRKQKKIKLPDAIIDATAIVNNLTIGLCSHFQKTPKWI